MNGPSETSESSSSFANCAHDKFVEDGGACVCRLCGLVLGSSAFVHDEYAFHQYPLRKSSYYSWQKAVKTVLRRLGISLDVAESFGRPFDESSMSVARQRIAGGLGLEALASYCVLVRFRNCISSEEARTAGNATHKEWRRAAEIFGEQEPPDETNLSIYREARRLRIPDAVSQATLDAMQEPRLECCNPSKVLSASTGESLGDEIAGCIFGVSPAEIMAARAKYRVQNFAADLTATGLCLQFCVDRCVTDQRRQVLDRLRLKEEQGLVQTWWHGGALSPPQEVEEESLLAHLQTCARCAFRAQELGLSFLFLPQMHR